MQGIDAYTFNKIAGWVLFTALLVFGLNEVAHIVYHAERPERPGMTVEVAEQAVSEAAPAAEAAPIAERLAAANVEQGQAAARPCQACHTFDQGGPHRVGPNLWDVIGLPIAHHQDYSYSAALSGRSGETWTYEALDQFLANPRQFAPGTKMTYAGVRRDDQRADLIAYMRSLSDDPQPLPAAASEAQGAAPPAAEQPAAEQPAIEQPATGAAEQPAQ